MSHNLLIVDGKVCRKYTNRPDWGVFVGRWYPLLEIKKKWSTVRITPGCVPIGRQVTKTGPNFDMGNFVKVGDVEPDPFYHLYV